MPSLRFPKRERLCSRSAVTRLFGRPDAPDAAAVERRMAFPLRAVWAQSVPVEEVETELPQCRVMIVVPKKRLHKAVDRVKMRRRIREAYRLSRHLIPEGLPPVDLALLYVADELKPYDEVARAVGRILKRLALPQP